MAGVGQAIAIGLEVAGEKAGDLSIGSGDGALKIVKYICVNQPVSKSLSA